MRTFHTYFWNDGDVRFSLGVIYDHENTVVKEFITVTWWMILPKYIKSYGKFYWQFIIIVKFWLILVYYRIISPILYFPFTLYYLMLFQLLPHSNVILKCQYQLILLILVGILIIHLSDYWSYIIIHQFDNMILNVELYPSKVQYAKAFWYVFTANTHFHGFKDNIKNKLIPLKVILCPIILGYWLLM